MTHYNKTDTILDKILANKVQEIEAQKRMFDVQTVRRKSDDIFYEPRDFVAALRRDTVALIAEVKKASPSKGVLIEDFNPQRIGQTYNDNGAAAISVLTDRDFFQGELGYLNTVRQAVSVPVLRKDFIIDIFQVRYMLATRIAADAILLIAAVLDDAQLIDLHAEINNLDMAALVEVHNEAEMERVLKLDVPLIGINNRDLKSFTVDLETTARLANMVPDHVTLVAESGIQTADDVRRMGALGAHAVLVGESLVKSGDVDAMAQRVRDFSTQPRP